VLSTEELEAIGRKMGAVRAAAIEAVGRLGAPPPRHHPMADPQGSVSWVATDFRRGTAALHRIPKNGSFAVVDTRSGYSLLVCGSRPVARAMVRGIGASLEAWLDRAARGEPAAVKAMERLIAVYRLLDRRATPTAEVVKTGRVMFEGYELDGPRHVLGRADDGEVRSFVQRAIGKRGYKWIWFYRPAGTSWSHSAYPSLGAALRRE
jgi:hypothetical protein